MFVLRVDDTIVFSSFRFRAPFLPLFLFPWGSVKIVFVGFHLLGIL